MDEDYPTFPATPLCQGAVAGICMARTCACTNAHASILIPTLPIRAHTWLFLAWCKPPDQLIATSHRPWLSLCAPSMDAPAYNWQKLYHAGGRNVWGNTAQELIFRKGQQNTAIEVPLHTTCLGCDGTKGGGEQDYGCTDSAGGKNARACRHEHPTFSRLKGSSQEMLACTVLR